MNISNFNISIQETKNFFKRLDLFRMDGIKSINLDGVSEEFKTASQKNDYFNAYRIALRNFDYDFLLQDQSFFQFSYSKERDSKLPNLRYAFFQNPNEYISYEDYIELLRSREYIDKETPEEIGEIFQEEYEQFLAEQQINLSSTSLRYDIDVANYKPLIHSISHVHVGYSTDIRIPCDKILTPLKFSLFVTKHVYYFIWKTVIETRKKDIEELMAKEKIKCTELVSLDVNFWDQCESKELFIT